MAYRKEINVPLPGKTTLTITHRGIKHPFSGQHLIQDTANGPYVTFLVISNLETITKCLIASVNGGGIDAVVRLLLFTHKQSRVRNPALCDHLFRQS